MDSAGEVSGVRSARRYLDWWEEHVGKMLDDGTPYKVASGSAAMACAMILLVEEGTGVVSKIDNRLHPELTLPELIARWR